jgi:hypothetical protein
MSQQLLAASTNNNGGTPVSWNGGTGVFLGSGAFGGGTLAMQISVAGSTWFDASGVTMTADGSKLFDLPSGVSIRARVTSGTSDQTVSAWVHGMGN